MRNRGSWICLSIKKTFNLSSSKLEWVPSGVCLSWGTKVLCTNSHFFRSWVWKVLKTRVWGKHKTSLLYFHPSSSLSFPPSTPFPLPPFTYHSKIITIWHKEESGKCLIFEIFLIFPSHGGNPSLSCSSQNTWKLQQQYKCTTKDSQAKSGVSLEDRHQGAGQSLCFCFFLFCPRFSQRNRSSWWISTREGSSVAWLEASCWRRSGVLISLPAAWAGQTSCIVFQPLEVWAKERKGAVSFSDSTKCSKEDLPAEAESGKERSLKSVCERCASARKTMGEVWLMPISGAGVGTNWKKLWLSGSTRLLSLPVIPCSAPSPPPGSQLHSSQAFTSLSYLRKHLQD